MIQVIYCDEYGRVTGRAQEMPDEQRRFQRHADGGAVQVDYARGKQRRPAARLFTRFREAAEKVFGSES